jgi:arginyl-tRNA synthetase
VNQDHKNFRIKLSKLVSEIIGSGMRVLGISMPKRM